MMAVYVAKGSPLSLLGGRPLIKKDKSHEKEFISKVDFCKAGLQWTPRLRKQQISLPAVCCNSCSGYKSSKAIVEKGRPYGRWRHRKLILQCPNGELSCPCNDNVLLFDLKRITRTVHCSNSSSSSPSISNEDSVGDTVPKQYDSNPFIKPDEPLQSTGKRPTYSSTAQFQASVPVFSRRKFKGNRFLWWLKFRSNFNTAFERFFKSEIRRRAFVTVTLLIVSRIGYFIPLPGFDRHALPSDYLGFVSGRIEELGDLGSEMKLPIFQLGISPYLLASMGMQLACHLIPSLVKLRTKGFDGHAKIKKYTFRLTLLFAVLESLAIAYYSLPYAVCAAGNTFRHMTITTSLLTFGAMTLHWISEKITTAGFGEGSSLIVCLSILTGYAKSLQQIARSITYDISGCSALCLLLVSTFIITLWAVVVNEGRRKIKMQYFDLELMQNSGRLSGLPEVEPYIPFNINPTGMQPILTTSYLLAFPSIVASITGAQVWVRLKDMLNPALPGAPGAKPWLYHSLNMIFVFMFNVLDIGDTPKELSNYMMKIGTRIPNVKPGRQTIEYLGKVQASTRFWGGMLLGMLATVSTLVDYKLRAINQDISIGFTSMLIIVGSVAELRRSFKAYNVMPSLSKVLKRYGV